jgi:hypothetical protein
MNDEKAPLVLETPGGLSVSYQGRLLYSGRDPVGVARRLAASCDRGPSRLHLVPSPLLWHGVLELLAAMGPGSALLCVETDPILAQFSRRHRPPELAGDCRIAFIETRSPEDAVDAARSMGSFRACSIAALSGGQALDAAAYAAMAAALNADFQASWRNRAALMMLGPRWARNIFDNIASLPAIDPRPLPSFAGAVIVCGAGPSLEEALPLIVGARKKGALPGRLGGRLGVIACDTALGTLLAEGIEPDLVVCLEGQAHNLADFTCLGSRPAPLVADLSSHPATFRAVRGPKHLTFVRITRSAFLSRASAALSEAGLPFAPLPPLGSVGVHAVHLARLLSSGPLIAAGLDFCFDPGKTHARGCPSLLAEERRLDRLTRWPGQYAASFRDRTIILRGGGKYSPAALSDPILLSYAALLASGEAADDGRALYDLRRRGPSIGGSRISLEEAAALVDGRATDREASSSDISQAAISRASASRSIPAILAFLQGEERRLDELRLSMHGTAPLAKDEFLRLVAESDYLWWGFPDHDRARELPQDFLNRLVPQVEFWSLRLRELVTSLQ